MSERPSTPRPAERLRRSRDFAAVMRNGRRTRDPLIQLAARPNELPYSRVGYAVSRRVGGAVIRNRVKRRLREIARTLPFDTGYDIVAIPQHLSVQASFQELGSAFDRCARRLKLVTDENVTHS
ncbi:MAG: ribonuclease P protein component [Chloroflexi bacterium]|nr:ribonuclease P protein component [Chloroflexota bacterium]MDA1145937.1 ribonuclease P protein component [Chloroflexota bacterium]